MSFEKQNIKMMLESSSKEIEIDLSNKGFSDNKVKELVELLKEYPNREIKFLNLYCNDITDEGTEILSKLQNIVELNLGYNRIKNEGSKSLISNPKLRELDLSDNNITDDCVEFILHGAKQVYLNLTKNKITSENLAKISDAIRDNYDKSKGSQIGFFNPKPGESKIQQLVPIAELAEKTEKPIKKFS